MWAFSDESERGNLMLFGVLLAADATLPDARRELRRLLFAGQRRVHTAKESPTRRRLLLDTVGSLDATAIVFSARRTPRTTRADVRRRLLETATDALRQRGTSSWVLDRQDDAQAARDRQAIVSVLGGDHPLRYQHRPSHEEPLLWAIDALVWATGAGGDWRRRVNHLIELHELGP